MYSIADLPTELILNTISQGTALQAISFLSAHREYRQLLTNDDFLDRLAEKYDVPQFISKAQQIVNFDSASPNEQLEYIVKSGNLNRIIKFVENHYNKLKTIHKDNQIIKYATADIINYLDSKDLLGLTNINLYEIYARRNSVEHLRTIVDRLLEQNKPADEIFKFKGFTRILTDVVDKHNNEVLEFLINEVINKLTSKRFYLDKIINWASTKQGIKGARRMTDNPNFDAIILALKAADHETTLETMQRKRLFRSLQYANDDQLEKFKESLTCSEF